MPSISIQRSPWRSPFQSVFGTRNFLPRSVERMLHMMEHSPFAVETTDSVAIGRTPVFEIGESNGEYTCSAELPGMSEADLTVWCEGDTLTITAEHSEEHEPEAGPRFELWERSFSSVQRTFTLPGPVDAAHVVAEFKNGVLTVRMPRKKWEGPERRAKGRPKR